MGFSLTICYHFHSWKEEEGVGFFFFSVTFVLIASFLCFFYSWKGKWGQGFFFIFGFCFYSWREEGAMDFFFSHFLFFFLILHQRI